MLGPRTIFIGDVHGCAEELKELLAKLQLGEDDRLVFLGDLVDKGPNSLEVIRVVRGLRNTDCIAGNHEDTAFRKHGQGKEGEPWTKKATEDDWRYLESLPLLLRLPSLGITAVHGGFFPKFWKDHPEGIGEVPAKWHRGGGKRMERIRRFLRVRSVSQEDGDFVALGAEKPGDPHWSETYDGREGTVFYGHDPIVGQVRMPKSEPGVGLRIVTGRAYGIDTGCVFGGTLTAAIVHSVGVTETGSWLHGEHAGPTFMSVPAKAKYAEPLVMEAP